MKFQTLFFALMSTASTAGAADDFDGRWRLGDVHSLVTELHGNALRPRDIDVAAYTEKERKVGGGALSVRYDFNAGRWFANAHYGRTEDTIRTGTEFARQPGNENAVVALGRSWGSSAGSWWTSKSLRTFYEVSYNGDGQRIADKYGVELGFAGNLQSQLQVRYQNTSQSFAGRLIEFDRLAFVGRIRPYAAVELGIEAHVGDKLDFANMRPAVQWRVNPFLNGSLHKNLSLNVTGNRLSLDTLDGLGILEASLVDAQLSWQIADTGSVQIAVQQNQIERNPEAFVATFVEQKEDVGGRLSYSWKLNQYAQIQLGYADTFVDTRNVELYSGQTSTWFMQIGYSRPL